LKIALIVALTTIVTTLTTWIGRVAGGLGTVPGELTRIRCLSAQAARSKRGKHKNKLEDENPRGTARLHL
jgi:hypothetical protein